MTISTTPFSFWRRVQLCVATGLLLFGATAVNAQVARPWSWETADGMTYHFSSPEDARDWDSDRLFATAQTNISCTTSSYTRGTDWYDFTDEEGNAVTLDSDTLYQLTVDAAVDWDNLAGIASIDAAVMFSLDGGTNWVTMVAASGETAARDKRKTLTWVIPMGTIDPAQLRVRVYFSYTPADSCAETKGDDVYQIHMYVHDIRLEESVPLD